MSRNKENNPLSTAQRNAAIAPLHRTLPSEEFFTDSLIDDSRLSDVSHIPSPVKTGPVKPRRALGTSKALQTGKDSGNRSSRTSLFDYTAARTSKQLKPSPKLFRRKSPSPARTNGLTTPPHSRHGPPLTSPTEFSSPPGGLHESYQRIADEEDLAATERDVDSDEDVVDGGDLQDTSEMHLDVSPTREGIITEQSEPTHVSQQLTPVQSPSPARAEMESPVDERVESLSEPPTLDFVKNELTDRVLAAKLTPHVVDRAKDRARLEKLRQSRIPINFGEQAKEDQVNGEHRRNGLASVASRGPISFDNVLAVDTNGLHRTYSETSADFDPQKRLKAFRRATRPAVNKLASENDDGSDTPPELREKERLAAFSKSSRRKKEDSEGGEPQRPASVPKVLAFSRAHGRPRPYGMPTETTEDQAQPDDPTVASIASTVSEPLPGTAPQLDEDRATRAFLARWRKEAAERRAAKAREGTGYSESQIDWAAAAADIPLPSIEKSSTPQETPPKSIPSSSIQKQRSLDRMRKWENDFTGLSFQVSESPPVRTRTNLNDTLREKEIEDLAKQAVTTNRLDEIREKDPNVIVRKTSRNFSPQERKSAPPEPRETSSEADNVDLKDLGEAVPNTPVVVYRSASSSTDKSKSSQRSMPDSLDQLQRLARAVSTTPRPSPPTHGLSVALDDASAVPLPPSEDDLKSQSSLADHDVVDNKKKVAETPKVMGAWTDTILPDTVKTRIQTQRASKYAQTPHVTAGGWIETPLPKGDRVLNIQIPSIVEEETVELVNGETPEDDPATDHMGPNTAPSAVPVNEEQGLKLSPKKEEVILPKSALTNVLNEAKQKRLVPHDITDAPQDENDTLNLGDATIQSFEDLLTDAADITADLTSLIKAGAEEEVLALRERNKLTAPIALDEDNSTASEVAFIGHLTSRMERLMSNLHEARKGIARLEQKVSHTPSISLAGSDHPMQALVAVEDPNQTCMRCGRRNDDISHAPPPKQSVSMSSFMAIPIAYTTFTLPIPLLFHPRTASNDMKRRNRLINLLPGSPTWLGYLTFSIWVWYVLECVLAEIYARPLYAERYIWPTKPEPEFPFVLPTMLYRWFLGGTLGSMLIAPILTVSGVVWRLLVAVCKVMGMWLGWWDGFVDDDRTRSIMATATKSAVQAVQSLVSGTSGANAAEAEGLSMMNDEIL